MYYAGTTPPIADSTVKPASSGPHSDLHLRLPRFRPIVKHVLKIVDYRSCIRSISFSNKFIDSLRRGPSTAPPGEWPDLTSIAFAVLLQVWMHMGRILGLSWLQFGEMFKDFWGLGAPWSHLGDSWRLLEASWKVLEPSWSGRSWAAPEQFLDPK